MNEDSFQCLGKIYPVTLDAFEQCQGVSKDYWQVFSVADGLGGAGIGDISARTIQRYILELQRNFIELDPVSFDFSSYIQDFVERADRNLRTRLEKYANQAVGCSLALIFFAGSNCYTMSIGSCRIYLLRDEQLYAMTRDHVMPNDAAGRPLLFLGNHPGVRVLKAQNVSKMRCQEGDSFVLVSDGVSKALSDEEIMAAILSETNFALQLKALFDLARNKDASDNQTVLGLKFGQERGHSLTQAKQIAAIPPSKSLPSQIPSGATKHFGHNKAIVRPRQQRPKMQQSAAQQPTRYQGKFNFILALSLLLLVVLLLFLYLFFF